MSNIGTYIIINVKTGKNANELPVGKMKNIKASYNSTEEVKTAVAVLNRFANMQLFKAVSINPLKRGIGKDILDLPNKRI